jgi:hypothetical protein
MTQTTSLSPDMQRLLQINTEAQQRTAGAANRAAGMLGETLNAPVVTDWSADRQRVEDALMGRLDTQLNKDRAAMDASLAARGIKVGSGAYSDTQQDFGRNVAESRTSAILGAGQEQNRLANLQNSQRSQSINEVLSLMGGGQMQSPQFSGTPQTGVGGTDIVGPTMQGYQQQLGQYQQQQGDMFGGLFGLGKAALPLLFSSDERLKENIEPTGEEVAGVPVVEYDRKDGSGHERGVLAQEVEKKHPELVYRRHDGMRVVDYGGLMRLGTHAREAA